MAQKDVIMTRDRFKGCAISQRRLGGFRTMNNYYYAFILTGDRTHFSGSFVLVWSLCVDRVLQACSAHFWQLQSVQGELYYLELEYTHAAESKKNPQDAS